MNPTLGSEIKRLRLEAGFSLRQFAGAIHKSPPYQSDIEHDRRMPSERTLRDMVTQLKPVGATYEGFKQYDGRFDPEVKEMVVRAPEANRLLRATSQLAEALSVPLNDILRDLREDVDKRLESARSRT